MNDLIFALLLGWSTVSAFPTTEKSSRPQEPTATVAASTAQPAAAKHVILFFTADRCPSCLRMKSQTLPYVALPGHDLRQVDVDANPGLAQAYGVQSIPAYIVLDGAGRAYRHGVGFRDVAQFIAFLNGQ